jgi:hypothetical protein
MTIVKGAAALVAAAFVIVGAAVPAQAQSDWNGWQASSVNSPNRDFLSDGAQPNGDYSRTFGFDTGAGAEASASCYPAHVRYRLRNGHIVSRNETICP